MNHTCSHQAANTGLRCVRLAVYDVAHAGNPEAKVPTCAAHLAYFVEAAVSDDVRGFALVADHIHPVRHG